MVGQIEDKANIREANGRNHPQDPRGIRVVGHFEPGIARWAPLVAIRLPNAPKKGVGHAQQATRSGSLYFAVGSKMVPPITLSPREIRRQNIIYFLSFPEVALISFRSFATSVLSVKNHQPDPALLKLTIFHY